MIRGATATDRDAITALHWASWRTHYRAVLPAAYLDGDLGADLAALWAERLPDGAAPDLILVAGEIDGFIAGFAEAGTLYIDNLHVAPDRRGKGIGPRLLGEAARRAQRAGLAGAHLWVFDANAAAFAFYTKLGGVITARQTERVFGRADAAETRFDWPDLGVLARN